MLNVSMLKKTTSENLNDAALEARQWSIINNAVRELLHALGYEGPFRDNDMRVAMALKAAAQHLQGPEDYQTSEHSPLAPVGAPTSPVIDRISNILEKGLEAEFVREKVELPIIRTKATPKDADPQA
jgi:hypothetical protein